MLKNLKIKMLGAAVVASVALLVSVSAFAANTVSITSATTASSVALSDTAATAPAISKTDLITVNTTISTPGADVTIMVLDSSIDITSATIDDSDIKYIDQETSDATSGACSLTFRMPLDIASGTYAVYVGGEDVTALAKKYLKISSSSSETYLCGDIDGNGSVDGDDAMWALRYEIGLAVPSSYNIDAGDVDGNGSVDGDDAMWILRYEIGLTIPSSVPVGQEISL